MTSMPASRRALAMIFAPRSWPSRPGLAITTRILAGTSAEYRGASERHRLLPGLAEPGQRALRVHGLRERDPFAARLRAGRARPSARGRAVAAYRGHRDHALAPRPLGRSRAVGLGQLLPRDERAAPPPRSLGAAARRRVPHRPRPTARLPGHVRADVRATGVRAGHGVLRRSSR